MLYELPSPWATHSCTNKLTYQRPTQILHMQSSGFETLTGDRMYTQHATIQRMMHYLADEQASVNRCTDSKHVAHLATQGPLCAHEETLCLGASTPTCKDASAVSQSALQAPRSTCSSSAIPDSIAAGLRRTCACCCSTRLAIAIQTSQGPICVTAPFGCATPSDASLTVVSYAGFGGSRSSNGLAHDLSTHPCICLDASNVGWRLPCCLGLVCKANSRVWYPWWGLIGGVDTTAAQGGIGRGHGECTPTNYCSSVLQQLASSRGFWHQCPACRHSSNMLSVHTVTAWNVVLLHVW